MAPGLLPTKDVFYRSEAREKLLHGISALADAVRVPTCQDLEARARQAARARLFGLKAAAARSGMRVRTHLPAGLPEEEVGRVARRRRAGLVVIGTHGRTGLARAVLGSVAERIVRTSGCPVLTVRGRR